MSHRNSLPRRIVTLAAATALTTGATACHDGQSLVENWGPPTGYAVITGTIRHTSGAPVVGQPIQFAGCHPDVATITPASTDLTGAYGARAWLPPSLTSRPDTVFVTCSVVLQLGAPPIDSLRLAFSADSLHPVRHSLDLTLP